MLLYLHFLSFNMNFIKLKNEITTRRRIKKFLVKEKPCPLKSPVTSKAPFHISDTEVYFKLQITSFIQKCSQKHKSLYTPKKTHLTLSLFIILH